MKLNTWKRLGNAVFEMTDGRRQAEAFILGELGRSKTNKNIDDLRKDRKNGSEIIALSRNHPIVKAHLTVMQQGDCDWITAIELMVIDLADSSKRLSDALFKCSQRTVGKYD